MKKIIIALILLMICNIILADANDVNNINEIALIPFDGNEISLQEVQAYPEKYTDKTFEVIGGVRIIEYYNYGYDNAQKTHISLNFNEVRPNKTYTRESLTLYVKKTISKSLTDAIIKAINDGLDGKLIRARISILGKRYDPLMKSNGGMAELINWQFLSNDKSKWLSWCIQDDDEPNTSSLGQLKIKRIPSFDPNNGIIYNGKKRSKLWFYQVYKMFYSKIAVVDGKYEYVEGKLITDKNKQVKIICRQYQTNDVYKNFVAPAYDPLTRDQFADALNNGFLLKRKIVQGGQTIEKEIP